MPDPSPPDGPDTPKPPREGDVGEGVEREAAVQLVRTVAGLYQQRILQERRTAEPDHERLDELMAAFRAATADQRALEDASPEETARITATYQARYAELTKE